MKVGKTQAVLYIFEQLFGHKGINKKDIMNELSISDLTFRRYIQELRAYLMNFNEKYEIEYIKTDDAYLLKRI